MSNLDTIKARIRKLLNLAGDDAAFDGEIDNALRAARKLMLENNLTESDVAQPGAVPLTPEEVAEQTEYGEDVTFTQGLNLSTWECYLGYAINELIGTVAFYYNSGILKRVGGILQYDGNGNPIRSTRITFYGPVEDVRDAAMLFSEWGQVIVATSRLKWGGVFRGEGRSYAEGFATGLRYKVANLKRQDQSLLTHKTGSTGTALMVVQAHAVMAAKWKRGDEWLKKDRGIKLRLKNNHGRAGSQHTEAFSEGRSDGQRSDFSRTVTRKLAGA